MPTSPQQTQDTDQTAVVALVLAFLLPPVGLLLALYGGTRGGRYTGLRTAAIAVGVVLTVLSILVAIMVLGTAAA